MSSAPEPIEGALPILTVTSCAGAAAGTPSSTSDASTARLIVVIARTPLISMRVTAAVGRWRLAAGRSEGLVVERRRDRLLHHDEAVLRNLVAGIAGCGQLVEGDGELDTVARFDRLGDLGELALVERRNDRLDRDAMRRRVKPRDVGEAGLELVEAVLGELPVVGGDREPELGVPDLLQDHQLAQPRRVAAGGGRWAGVMVLRKRGPRHQRKRTRHHDPSHHRPPHAGERSRTSPSCDHERLVLPPPGVMIANRRRVFPCAPPPHPPLPLRSCRRPCRHWHSAPCRRRSSMSRPWSRGSSSTCAISAPTTSSGGGSTATRRRAASWRGRPPPRSPPCSA